MAHDELTHGIALGGHILLANHGFARVDGLTPIAGFYPGQALHAGSPDPTVESRPEQRLHHQWDAIDQGKHER